ncbi:unnamed protein product [Clonostachys solani]|uniref:Uncharacterized protein n=1 Tax=Clonostachys solani TaxID=160281 RepID=A0A9N9W1C3_9HYPO|nr:unnamed protein product [Clonostachys solani]
MSDQHHGSSRRSHRNGDSSERRHRRPRDGGSNFTLDRFLESNDFGAGTTSYGGDDFHSSRASYQDRTIHGHPPNHVDNRYAGQSSIYSYNDHPTRNFRQPQHQRVTGVAHGSSYGQRGNGQPARRHREETPPFFDDVDSIAGRQGSPSSIYSPGQSRPRPALFDHDRRLPSDRDTYGLDINPIGNFTTSTNLRVSPPRQEAYRHRAGEFLGDFDTMFGSSRRDEDSGEIPRSSYSRNNRR